MPRPVKWSRDIHPILNRAKRSRTETWSRQDIQDLFGIGASSAQSLMKAIGGVQTIGGTHFVDRPSLLCFLDEMAGAESVEEALRSRTEGASRVPRAAPLRTSLPAELRRVTLDDLPSNVEIGEGEIRITGAGAEQVVEGLLLVAQVLQNDLEAVRQRLDPPPPEPEIDEELRKMLADLRRRSSST